MEGGLCPGEGGLCPREGGSLSRGGGGLCLGGSLSRRQFSVWGSLSGGSLSRVVSVRETPLWLYAVDTYPAGMHSCFFSVFITLIFFGDL